MDFIQAIRHSQSGIFKVLVFLFCLCVIVYVLPRETHFRYEYKGLLGKPWPYNDLTSEFDFAVKKSAEELEKEKNELISEFHPFYRADPEAANAPVENFKSKVREEQTELSKEDKQTGLRILEAICKKGVIRLDPGSEEKGNRLIVSLLNGNIAEERELQSFFTLQQAVAYLNAELENYNSPGKPLLKNILENCIEQTVFYDEVTSKRLFGQLMENVSPARDVILRNQNIISKGELLTKEKFQVLESLSAEYETQLENSNEGTWFLVAGQAALVAFCLGIMVLFLYLFRKDVYGDNTRFFFVLFMILLMTAGTALVEEFRGSNAFYFPFCIAPIVIRAFYDTRIALFVHLVIVMITSFIVQNNFTFFFIQLTGGIMAIFSIASLRTRSQFFFTSLVVLLSYLFCFLGLRMMQDNGLQNLSWKDLGAFPVSAALTLFSFPLIFLFEKTFGFVSDVTLIELSSNTALLRELASKAPGTFQHSLQVASLSEDVVYEIGGNPLLVRAGALYHDIGKMDMPQYFMENQVSGVNPHQELGYGESASIIISHVLKGIELARHHGIPDAVIDFIRTHHGTTRTEYFFRRYREDFPNEPIIEDAFRYRGPLPYSKETAVVMICDSVEAASRSMKTYGGDAIAGLVDSMIDRLVRENQFIHAEITFRDLTVIRKTLKKKLMNIYHGRIEYPKG